MQPHREPHLFPPHKSSKTTSFPHQSSSQPPFSSPKSLFLPLDTQLRTQNTHALAPLTLYGRGLGRTATEGEAYYTSLRCSLETACLGKPEEEPLPRSKFAKRTRAPAAPSMDFQGLKAQLTAAELAGVDVRFLVLAAKNEEEEEEESATRAVPFNVLQSSFDEVRKSIADECAWCVPSESM